MATIAFLDSETRSLLDVTQVGAFKYAKHHSTDVTVWGYAFDEGHGTVWSPDWAWSRNVDASPEELLDHVAEGGYLVAWNAFFDRHIWNEVMVKKYGWPPAPLEQWLCAQAQAEANNLPGKLEKAAECLGTAHKKDPKGKALIGQLCTGDRSTWNRELFETSEKMGHFRSYCVKDVTSMRDVWQATRPLTTPEWDEYHASERINDRGVAVDVDFARAAKQYAQVEAQDINGDLAKVTGDPLITVTNHLRKARFLYDMLWFNEEIQQIVERPPTKKAPDKRRFSCDRPTREAVLEMLKNAEGVDGGKYAEGGSDDAATVVQFLELIEAGNSAAVNKFRAIVNQEIDGRVHGGYSFNGAGTGRFTSRGLNVQNIIRAPVDYDDSNRAVDAIEMIMAGEDPQTLVDEFGFPLSRLLARLIRPTFIAPPGKTLVWGDWDQIEARCLPWLAASPSADAKLDLFRQGQDVYKFAAMPIYNVGLDDVDDHMRQVGKVCIAEGQQVLTDAGLVPIEAVKPQHLVWDGESFVSHSGLVYNGKHEIIDYQGLSATPDHVVWTEDRGAIQLIEAARHRSRITQTGAGESEIRVCTDNIPAKTLVERLAASESIRALRQMPSRWLDRLQNNSKRDKSWLPAVCAAPTCPGMAIEAFGISATPLHQPQRRPVPQLRGSRDRVPFSISVRSWFMGDEKYRSGEIERNRSDRQQRALRSGEYPVGDATATNGEYAAQHIKRRLARFTVAVQQAYRSAKTAFGHDTRRNSGRRFSGRLSQAEKLAFNCREAHVYDITDAGPRHRFTVSNCLVHNCELALGFGGAVGAFSAMGRGYGITLPEDQVRQIVDRWRAQNSWCVDFWHELWQAAMDAFNDPGIWYHVGRVRYLFHPALMRGTLICQLPDGRLLVYPQFKHERVVVTDDEGVERVRWQTTCVKGFGGGYGRVELWYGILAENITQAIAASFLRRALLKLEEHTVLHTHDEIVAEVPEHAADQMELLLEEIMTDLPDWAEGLPLTVSVETGPFYTK